MTFGCWAMTLCSSSCHDHLTANFHCCGSFQLFFDIHDKSGSPWRFKCNSPMSQAQLLAGDPRTGHMTSSYMMSSHVTKTSTSITPHRIEVEPLVRSHCVCLVKTHKLICNMTYLGHPDLGWGRLTWPKVKFSDWPFGVKTHMCRCLSTRGMRCCTLFLSLSS